MKSIDIFCWLEKIPPVRASRWKKFDVRILILCYNRNYAEVPAGHKFSCENW